MTRFSQHFSRAAVPNMQRQFGESITYYPIHGGSGRVITGIVHRDIELINEVGNVSAQATVITVQDSATEGIPATEIDTGGDEVSYPLRIGETAKRKSIVRVMGTHNGTVRFLVQ